MIIVNNGKMVVIMVNNNSFNNDRITMVNCNNCGDNDKTVVIMAMWQLIVIMVQ